MTLPQLKQYWQEAAENHIDIRHTLTEKRFCSFSVEEALASLKDMMYPAICLEMPITRPTDNNSDNILIALDSAILIIQKVEASNHQEIEQAFVDTEVIARDMMSKLLNDRKKAFQDGVTAPRSLIKHLDVTSLELKEVGPIFDTCYGWRLDFKFLTPNSLALDESRWLPDTETKFNFINS